MEDFIKSILDIDQEAKQYASLLKTKKMSIIKEREDELKKIKDEYQKILKEEQVNLLKYTQQIQEKEMNKLEDFKKKSDKIKNSFSQKKSELVDKYAKLILESGDFDV